MSGGNRLRIVPNHPPSTPRHSTTEISGTTKFSEAPCAPPYDFLAAEDSYPDSKIYIINYKQTKPETHFEGYPLKNKNLPPITVPEPVLKTLTRASMRGEKIIRGARNWRQPSKIQRGPPYGIVTE